MARAHVVTYETLLSEEENQILGVSHVANIAGVNASFLTLFSVTDFGYLIKWGEVRSAPLIKSMATSSISRPCPHNV